MRVRVHARMHAPCFNDSCRGVMHVRRVMHASLHAAARCCVACMMLWCMHLCDVEPRALLAGAGEPGGSLQA